VQELVAATNNAGKIVEIQAILKDFLYRVVPINQIVKDFEVVEDGQTYQENAIKKARIAALQTQRVAIADDSGLEVDALDGAPGVYSARFGGEQLSQAGKIALLLAKLTGKADRTARFRCAIAVVTPDGKVKTSEGVCEGVIAMTPQGTHGFGYDPIFIVPAYQQTMAELGPEIKNQISHRAQALRHLPALVASFAETSAELGMSGRLKKNVNFC